MRLLEEMLLIANRIRLEVLVGNQAGRAFWRAVGFKEYAVTLELLRPTTETKS